MKNVRIFLFFLLIFFQVANLFSQLTTNTNSPYNSPQYLVQSVLSGGGMTTSNFTFIGDPKQIGFFNGMNSNLGIDSGIVLVNDDILEIISGGGGTGIGTFGGDTDLLTIANSVPGMIGQSFSVSSTNDKAVLEFDFIPFCDSMKFDYVFGSDEYLTYVNTSYNDVFAFFISGPGITGPYQSPPAFPNGSINIAFVPNSSPPLPITISSVNNVLNPQYYIDNPANTTVGLNGFTTVFTASVGVNPGETYHLKLAIADGSDGAMASAVFLNAKSFGSNGTSLDLTLTTTDATCSGSCNGTAMVSGPDSVSYLWSNGETDSLITNLCEGQYSVSVSADSSVCPTIGSVTIGISDTLPLNLSTQNNNCFGGCDGSATVHFQDSSFFLWSNGQTDSAATGLCSGQFSVTVTKTDSNCVFVSTVNITQPLEISVNTFSIPDSGNSVGAAKSIVSGGNPPYSFLWSDPAQQTVFNPTGLSAGTYFVTVTDSNGCNAIDSVVVDLISGESGKINFKKRVQILPNPNNGVFHLTGEEGWKEIESVKILNLFGEIILILEKPTYISDGKNNIEITSPNVGIYLLGISFYDGNYENYKFVITGQ